MVTLHKPWLIGYKNMYVIFLSDHEIAKHFPVYYHTHVFVKGVK